jgi:hypothetical protein
MTRPLCFVLMPFGVKSDPMGQSIDFDAVYRGLIAPAIASAGMEPLRADEEMGGGIIHKPMFQRLILCEYAVADLTTANANVFYELGARHAMRPWSTVLIFAQGGRLAFDLAPDRVLHYQLDASGSPVSVRAPKKALTARLQAARDAQTDSPVYQLVEGLPPPQLEQLKADVFREQVRRSLDLKGRLGKAREHGSDAVHRVEAGLGPIRDNEAGVIMDLLFSYRTVKDWESMITLVDKMSPSLASTVIVQEQLGFALNRAKRRREAERVLMTLLQSRGPSSETYGILARVYKDLWQDAIEHAETIEAGAYLSKAIETYLLGFETDWRDAYPGINAVVLMEVRQPLDARRQEILPVVRYAVARRLASNNANYWDQANRLELAVLDRDESAAMEALGHCLATAAGPWELETTQRNVGLLRAAREARGEAIGWTNILEDHLDRRVKAWPNTNRQ